MIEFGVHFHSLMFDCTTHSIYLLLSYICQYRSPTSINAYHAFRVAKYCTHQRQFHTWSSCHVNTSMNAYHASFIVYLFKIIALYIIPVGLWHHWHGFLIIDDGWPPNQTEYIHGSLKRRRNTSK